MRELTLQTDSIENKRPGVWPWVIGAAALIALVSSVNSAVKNIHSDIKLTSRPVVENYTAQHPHNNVTVAISGRDLLLKGTINAETSRSEMVEQLRQLDSVRVVKDELQEVNPLEQARIAGENFNRLLEQIDASSITFNAGSTTLATSDIPAINQLASLLNESPERRIKITGHTDNSGNAQANLKISQQRAESVAQALISKGVKQEQLIVQGFGHTRPLYSNDTEAGRSKNRRIELIFMN